MLDLSKVPVVDSNVKPINSERCIKLEDNFSCSELDIPESKFNKYFKMFKEVLDNEDRYRGYFASTRGHKWFRPRAIDSSLDGSDYFMVDRVPIYVEMFKHISKYKVYLDRDSLLSQDISVLETLNKKIKTRKTLNKIEGLLYLNL